MPRVLVIEDSPTQAQQISMVLEDAGFTVETQPDAERGMRRLSVGGIDVVLSDLHLPGDSGFVLCRRVKANPFLRGIPVVVCTSEADPVNVLRGLEAGADGFITKNRPPERRVRAKSGAQRRRPMAHRARPQLDFSIIGSRSRPAANSCSTCWSRPSRTSSTSTSGFSRSTAAASRQTEKLEERNPRASAARRFGTQGARGTQALREPACAGGETLGTRAGGRRGRARGEQSARVCHQ